MLDQSELDKLAAPVIRRFYKSDNDLAAALYVDWDETQASLNSYIDEVLSEYQADAVTYHQYQASGLAFFDEARVPDLPGLDKDMQTLGEQDVVIVTADIRHDAGKTLRTQLKKISAMRINSPDFGPYCIGRLGLDSYKTMGLSSDNARSEIHFAFAGLNADQEIVLSIPTGGSETLVIPDLNGHFKRISEQAYLESI